MLTNDPVPFAADVKRKTTPGAADTSSQCSRAVRALETLFPAVLKAHVLALPPSRLTALVLEEVCLRLMSSFVALSAQTRPATDASRGRVLADLALVEQLVRVCPAVCAHLNAEVSSSAVATEFKVFRGLLGMGALKDPVNSPTNLALLKSRHYTSALRPSTLIGYLVAMAPPQLPSPVSANDTTAASFLAMLLAAPPPSDSDAIRTLSPTAATFKTPFGFESVEWLHVADLAVNEGQSQFWSLVLQCLDVLMQRSAVAEPLAKEAMRRWYQVIVDVGGHYFSSKQHSR
jgi:hypothetical protein